MESLFAYILLVSLLLATVSEGSEGDRSEAFQTCLRTCLLQDQKSVHGESSWMYQWLWGLEGNCKYECMRRDYRIRRTTHQPIVQYYGKWPFRRWAGLQEPLSVLASALNLAAHVQGFGTFYRRLHVPRNPYHVGYLFVGIAAWMGSLVFHWRDTPTTERLDYFGAAALVLYGTFMALATVYVRRHRPILLLMFIVFYVYHVAKLMVFFDYGYNIRVLAVFGVSFNLSWIVAYKLRMIRHPLAWRLPTLMLATALLEVFDFAPIFDILDAHALWHLLTAPLGYWLWRLLSIVQEESHLFPK